ncbi:hypothetical protein CUD01_07830 [Cellulomonas uda]|uniref:HTH marR-type domain-containing protein n=2 Tax=Cellulomonadaceae TaxID=85016 RepID=A0A4Y3K740_CELUD|nr:hypothetical protein CUD01_07830 [Cellulomonas uda]
MRPIRAIGHGPAQNVHPFGLDVGPGEPFPQGHLTRQDVRVMDDDLQQLERELGLFLRRATASSTAMARRVHPELEPSAYELLALIERTPGVRASDLAAYIGVGRGTMSRQLARLGALGLLTRSPDPDDFRGQLLALTPEGSCRLASAQQARTDFLARALEDWAPEQISQLTAQLGRLNRDLSSAWATQPATPAASAVG